MQREYPSKVSIYDRKSFKFLHKVLRKQINTSFTSQNGSVLDRPLEMITIEKNITV